MNVLFSLPYSSPRPLPLPPRYSLRGPNKSNDVIIDIRLHSNSNLQKENNSLVNEDKDQKENDMVSLKTFIFIGI